MMRRLNPARGSFGLSASVAYALLRLEASGGLPGVTASICPALRQALIHGVFPPLGQELHDLAHSGMPDAIVPFRRDPLDIAYAAAAIHSTSPFATHSPRPFVLFTEGARVEAGYFAVHPRRIEYVDQLPPHQHERPLDKPEMFDHGAVQPLLEELRGAIGRPPRLSVPSEGEDILHIDGALLGGKPGETLDFTATLFRLADDTCVSIAMGKLALVASPGRLTLAQVRPETLMELQAASIAGAWIHLQHPGLELLFPLPDLTEPGAACEGWCYPLAALEQGLVGNARAEVAVETDPAFDLMRAIPWCALPWPDQWVQLAARTHAERVAAASAAAA